MSAIKELLNLRKPYIEALETEFEYRLSQQFSIYRIEELAAQLDTEGLSQRFLLDADPEEHVWQLLDCHTLKFGASVLDVGCGRGEMARIARKLRPDLQIHLLNLSLAQLRDCPDLRRVRADLSALPYADRSFDAVWFLYSMGYGHSDRTITEGSRVLKEGGYLVVNDLFSKKDHTALAPFACYGYLTQPKNKLIKRAAKCGLQLRQTIEPTVIEPGYLNRTSVEDRDILFQDVYPRVMIFQQMG